MQPILVSQPWGKHKVVDNLWISFNPAVYSCISYNVPTILIIMAHFVLHGITKQKRS